MASTSLLICLSLLLLGVTQGLAFQEWVTLKALTNDTDADAAIVFSPQHLLQVTAGTEHLVNWTSTVQGVSNIRLHNTDEKVATIEDMDNSTWFLTDGTDGRNVTVEGSFIVRAKFLGYSNVTLSLFDEEGEVIGTASLPISVLLSYQKLSTIFSQCIGVLIGILYVNMGATIDLSVVKQIAKKPIGPILGIICQYGFMPLIAFGMSQLIFKDNKLLQLGMFLSGTCPGGGSSNMWTLLLGGRLDLSIMMTFSSSFFAFAAIPAWVLLLGPVIAQGAGFAIPFERIAIILVTLVVPCVVGLCIQRFLPKVARILEILLTPFALFNILFILTFGMYANRYIFEIIDTKILLAGLGLPVLGFIAGIVSGLIMRLPWKDCIAISVETGIQNTAIALFILQTTLEKPAGSIAVVVPGATVLMTPFPLLLVYIIKVIYTKCKARFSPDEKTKAVTNENKTEKEEELPSSTTKTGIDNVGADLADQSI